MQILLISEQKLKYLQDTILNEKIGYLPGGPVG